MFMTILDLYQVCDWLDHVLFLVLVLDVVSDHVLGHVPDLDLVLDLTMSLSRGQAST